jgi:hypothetical protein
MEYALPIAMLAIGVLGIACITWVIAARMQHRPEPPAVVSKQKYVPPPNDDDVERMVAALQHTAQKADKHRQGAGED